MPRPNDVHQNKILENISVAYLQDTMEFIAPKVFPRIPVMKDSDSYFEFSAADLLRDDTAVRAPSSESAGTDYALTAASYLCKRYANHLDIDWSTRANQDGELVTDEVITKVLLQKAMISFERTFAAAYFTTGKWTGSTTGTDLTATVKWNKGGSTPVADVDTQRNSIKHKIGYKPNIMVVNSAVHAALKNNADILARLGANERGVLTPDIMASIFEVDQYLVADAVYNSANKGATKVVAPIFGTDGVLLTYANPNANILTPSAGYIFASKQFASNDWGLIVRKMEMPLKTSDRLEVEFKLDAKLVMADASAFWTSVL